MRKEELKSSLFADDMITHTHTHTHTHIPKYPTKKKKTLKLTNEKVAGYKINIQ